MAEPASNLGKLRELDPSRPPVEGLVAALDGVLLHAARQVWEVPQTPAKAALHEYRKSIRRARSLLKLVRSFLDDAVYAEVSERLRRAVLETSGLRDVDVLAEGASRLGVGETALADLLRAKQDTRQTVDTLQGELGWLGPVQKRVAENLPAVSWDDLAGALEVSLGRARRARRRVQRIGDAASVHAWRKRVKELRYQLELFGTGAAEYKKLSRLAEELGTVTDLLALKAQVRRHRKRLPAGGKRFSRDIDRRVDKYVRRAVRRSRRLFRGRCGVPTRFVSEETI